MDNRVILCFILTLLLLNFAMPLTCPPGTFLYTISYSGEQFCIECQDGTFLPYNDHEETSCRTCEEIREPALEILVSECNKTHDAVIHCIEGYYRDQARNPRETGKCVKCSECPGYVYNRRPCGTYQDTVCCWDENFDVAPNHDGVFICRERPWFCRWGEYFEERGFQCLPCPDNTFMPLDYHVHTECWKCREYANESNRPLHSVIIQPCNSTHAPVIGCENGFFINPNMSYSKDALGCSPCTDCSTTDRRYEGRKCDGGEDTVCCPEANMSVEDTPDGAKCKSSSIINPDRECHKGECLHQGRRKRSIDCVPCPLITEADHTDNTAVHLGNTDQETTFGPCTKDTFSNDDQETSSGRLSPLYIFVGIVIGLILSLACYLIYEKYCKHRCVLYKMQRPEKDEQTDPAGEFFMTQRGLTHDPQMRTPEVT